MPVACVVRKPLSLLFVMQVFLTWPGSRTPQLHAADPFAMAWVASVNRVVDTVDTAATLTDRPAIVSIAQTGLATANHLAGIDRDLPLGIMLYLDEEPGRDPRPVLFLPVSDIAALQQTVARIPGVSLQPTSDPTWYSVSTPDEQLPVRLADGYAYLAKDRATLERVPDAPVLNWGPHLRGGLCGAMIKRSGIPDSLLAIAERDLTKEFDRDLNRRDAEPDRAYRVRRSVTSHLQRSLLTLFHDWESLGASLDLVADSRSVQGRAGLRLQLHLDATEGSNLSETFQQLTSGVTYFPQPTNPPPALFATLNTHLPAEMRSVLQEVVLLLREQAEEEFRRQAAESEPHPAEGLFHALLATIGEGHLEAFLEFRKGTDVHMTLVGGVHTAETDILSQTIQTILPFATERNDVASVEMNAVALGPIPFHRIVNAEPRNRDVRLYGPDHDYYLGAGEQTLWFGVGSEDVLAHCQQRLDARDTILNVTPPLARVEIHATPILSLPHLQERRPTVVALLRQSLQASEGDGLFLTLSTHGRSLQCTVEIEPGILRFLGDRFGRPRSAATRPAEAADQ